ncbi:MAG: MlaD family protein [Bdellovibrionota bacterium]
MRNEFKAGMFIIISLMVFAFSIWFLGQERQIFSSQEHYFTNFPDVKGLAVGAPVRLGGITIGRIDSVDLANNGKDATVQVTFLINRDYTSRIRKDTVATIETQGLLGDRFLSLSIGQANELAAPGTILKSKQIGELSDYASKAGAVLDNTVEISDQLKLVTSQLAESTINELDSSVKKINKIAEALVQREGIMGQLIFSNDEVEAEKSFNDLIKNLDETAQNLKAVSANLANGGGTLGALLVDSELYDKLVKITDEADRSMILRYAIKSSLEKENKKKN